MKKGDKIALGNDKSLSITNWLQRELETELEGEYGEKLTMAKQIAKDIIQVYKTIDDPKGKLEYFKEIVDRTEGKAKQYTDITSNEETVSVSLFVPEKNND